MLAQVLDLFGYGKRRALQAMNERRALPMGRKEFDDWSTRIIQAALIPGATIESQKLALASELQMLGPRDSHKEDAYFIHSLRRAVIQQVAQNVVSEIKAAQKARFEAQNPPNSPENSAKSPAEVGN